MKKIFLESPSLQGTSHGFFSRRGGFSNGIYSSLNCGYNSNDDNEAITKNIKVVCNSLNIPYGNLVTTQQSHSNIVNIINTIKTKKIIGDAIITSNPSIGIGVLTADCAPILVYAKKKRVVGAIHAGWKGALNGIINNFMYSMNSIGVEAHDLFVSIGPCIGKESYEVDVSFFELFKNKNKKYSLFFTKKKNKNKYHFNLSDFITSKFYNLGVKNIWNADKDTLSDQETFYSHRYNYKKGIQDYGRMISAIILK